jgi:hypothetical protein
MFGLILPAASALLLAACTASATRFPVQRYVPVTREMEPLGELDLSNTLMRLTGLEGEMKLKYVGQMPESAGDDLVGASVYRVENWERFFNKNSGRPAYCISAPRWVAVNSKAGAPAWSNEISVSLLTLEDWEKFRPVAHESCAGGTYVRAQN